jgi:hypothetical protein
MPTNSQAKNLPLPLAWQQAAPEQKSFLETLLSPIARDTLKVW